MMPPVMGLLPQLRAFWALMAIGGLLALTPSLAWGQNSYQITMQVATGEDGVSIMRVGEDFVVEVSLTAQSRRGGFRSQFYRNYTAPMFPAGLTVVDRSESTRSSVAIVNGRYTQEFSHVMSYVVRPGKEGQYTVGPATMEADGKLYKADAITISILPPRAAPGVLIDGQDPDPALAGDEFFQVTISRDRVTVGQPVMVSWYLYSTSRLTERPQSDPPESQGFFSKSLFSQNHTYEMERVQLGSAVFFRTLVFRRMYWPQRTGTLTIAPRTVSYRTRSGFLNTGKTENRTSAEVKFDVQALPVTGRPGGFLEDHVGQYRLRLDLAPGSMKVGDAIDLTVTVEGEALMTACRGPVMPQLDWARLEPNGSPAITETVENEEKVLGVWKAKYVFIATSEGQHEFPALSFPYFDPVAQKYVTATTEPVKLAVAPAPPGSRVITPSTPGAGTSAGTSNVLAPKLKPPAVKDISGSSLRARFWKGSWRWWLMAAPPLVWLGFGVFRFLRRRRLADVGGLRRKAARSRRRQSITRVKAALRANRHEDFYGECERLLVDTLSEIVSRSAMGLVHAELQQALGEKKVPEDLIDEVLDTLEGLDFARYAPGTVQLAAEGPAQLDKTMQLLHRLDAFVE